MLREDRAVRAFVIALVASLTACNDPLRVVTFIPDPPAGFVFVAETNTVMTPNEDGEAEQIRRGWLADELTDRGMCAAGYVVETRQLVEPPGAPLSNAHDVVYSGRCL